MELVEIHFRPHQLQNAPQNLKNNTMNKGGLDGFRWDRRALNGEHEGIDVF